MNTWEKVPELEVVPAIHPDTISEQVAHSSNLGFKSITDNPAWRQENVIAIVGGGPSLKRNLDELRKYKYIMACGSVHDYLMSNGIVPTWCIICDPDEIMTKYIQYKSISTEYLVASQCHPKLFEHLKHNRVYLWHCASTLEEENKKLGLPKDQYLIGGGCTIGTRAIVMGMMFGFTHHALFGMDSSIEDNAHHAYDFVDPSNESLGDIFEIKLDEENSPTFKVAGYMLAQIQDFQKICEIYPQNVKFTVIGDGLMSYLNELANRKALNEVK